MANPFYWSVPSFVQAIIRKVYKPKDAYTITFTRDDKDEWIFSYSFFRNEPMVRGAAKVIDCYYMDVTGKAAVAGDQITITASTTKPEHHYSRMDYDFHNDDEWSFYNDSSTGEVASFCPVFPIMFGGYPQTVYINIKEPVKDTNREGMEFIFGKEYTDRVYNF